MPLRVNVTWSGVGGTPYLSSFWFEGETQTAADNAVTAVGTFVGAVDALIDGGVTWATQAEVIQVDLSSGKPEGLWDTTPVTGSGGASGVAVPFAAQGLLRLRTGSFVGGREVRGRLFIPGLLASQDGTPTATQISTINGHAATLIADSNSEWVVYSREKALTATVVSATLWSQWAMLRSRRPSFG